MAAPLLREIGRTDPSTLEDLVLIMAKNMEQSLLTAGATPGKDYSIRDLFTWSTPFALEVFKKKIQLLMPASFNSNPAAWWSDSSFQRTASGGR